MKLILNACYGFSSNLNSMWHDIVWNYNYWTFLQYSVVQLTRHWPVLGSQESAWLLQLHLTHLLPTPLSCGRYPGAHCSQDGPKWPSGHWQFSTWGIRPRVVGLLDEVSMYRSLNEALPIKVWKVARIKMASILDKMDRNVSREGEVPSNILNVPCWKRRNNTSNSLYYKLIFGL